VLAATVVGLLVGLFQALTQIQDQTLPHAVKLVAVIVAIIPTMPWLGGELAAYGDRLFTDFPTITR
jgi:type III secretion protein S